ncbi:MAG: hypothetical protein JNK99_00765 [Candidatus Accumulibacter sp.]|jgi:ubiquinone biosynthesis protein UbiJ|uniref:ubiquinone biosynthesis accessory factor UbiJ n=1 Tax=Accumulibacter sp. TaxID=2053492 RepID=UPI001A45F24F|nr:hypothetical protein [Accumulibacter sp.]MBL8393270.1 hypothetical protein [Accumulibacter sp.]
MFPRLVLAFLNHVLASDDWARGRLIGFAGKTAGLHWGERLLLLLTISEQGLLEIAGKGTTETVGIRLPDDAPVRLMTDRESLFSGTTISGSADLAETFGLVFRNLRWDVEDDMARLVGDIAARRGLQLTRQLAYWQLLAVSKLALGLTEYLTEESAAIAHRRDVERFCSEVDIVRDDLARFEKRLEKAAAAQKKRAA